MCGPSFSYAEAQSNRINLNILVIFLSQCVSDSTERLLAAACDALTINKPSKRQQVSRDSSETDSDSSDIPTPELRAQLDEAVGPSSY